MANEITQAIEKIGTQFEEFKKINDQKLEEERVGNLARARELSETLEKISSELSDSVKNKTVLEKRLSTYSDRIEILEALNDRPRMSIQEKVRTEYKAKFTDLVRAGLEDQQLKSEIKAMQDKYREQKDVLIGTTTAGGFALPEEISRSIDMLVLKLSEIVNHVKNVTVGSQDYKELVSVNEASYAWSTETGTRSATTSPVLRERAPTWGELYAFPRASNWSLRDLFFNVEQWLIDNVTEGFSVGLATAIWNGNGSGTLTGFTNTAPVVTDDYASPERNHAAFEYIPITAHGSPFAAAGFNGDDIINIVYALRPRYRPNSRFAMNTITQGHCRKLKDTTGQYLWQPSLQVGQPDRLLGYPLFTWEDMGNPTTADALPIAFGDFNKAYSLAMRTETEILRDPYATKGYTAFYVSKRFGGIVTNNNAVKFAKIKLT